MVDDISHPIYELKAIIVNFLNSMCEISISLNSDQISSTKTSKEKEATSDLCRRILKLFETNFTVSEIEELILKLMKKNYISQLLKDNI